MYYWERKTHQDAVDKRRALQLKEGKLRILAPIHWSGDAYLKVSSAQAADWIGVHVLFHRRRLVWWASEADRDEDHVHLGQLLLHGHSGWMPPSLLDQEETSGDESQVFGVFGSGPQGSPLKLALFVADALSCTKLKESISAVCAAD